MGIDANGTSLIKGSDFYYETSLEEESSSSVDHELGL
jgi:hypothetical protein